MATKNDASFLYETSGNHNNGIQFTNLNLNQIHQNREPSSFHSYNKTKTFKNDRNHDLPVVNNNYESSKSCERPKKDSWLETMNALTSYNNKDKEELKKRWKNSNTKITSSSSTLSLHIDAYENGLEARNSNEKESLSKEIYEAKTISSQLKNCFEFPRQQKDQTANNPEVMQFKASQKLVTPNQALAATESKSQYVDKEVESNRSCYVFEENNDNTEQLQSPPVNAAFESTEYGLMCQQRSPSPERYEQVKGMKNAIFTYCNKAEIVTNASNEIDKSAAGVDETVFDQSHSEDLQTAKQWSKKKVTPQSIPPNMVNDYYSNYESTFTDEIGDVKDGEADETSVYPKKIIFDGKEDFSEVQMKNHSKKARIFKIHVCDPALLCFPTYYSMPAESSITILFHKSDSKRQNSAIDIIEVISSANGVTFKKAATINVIIGKAFLPDKRTSNYVGEIGETSSDYCYLKKQ